MDVERKEACVLEPKMSTYRETESYREVKTEGEMAANGVL